MNILVLNARLTWNRSNITAHQVVRRVADLQTIQKLKVLAFHYLQQESSSAATDDKVFVIRASEG